MVDLPGVELALALCILALRLSDHALNSRSHDGPDLEDQYMKHDKSDSEHDEGDLDVELDKATAGFPVEWAPGIDEANSTSAAKDGWDNLAREGAVERHYGLIIFGKEGCFNANKGNGRREDDEKSGEEHDSN